MSGNSRNIPTNPFMDFKDVKIRDTFRFYGKHCNTRANGFWRRWTSYMRFYSDHKSTSFVRPTVFFLIGYYFVCYAHHYPHFKLQHYGVVNENYKNWFAPLYNKSRDPDWPEEVRW